MNKLWKLLTDLGKIIISIGIVLAFIIGTIGMIFFTWITFLFLGALFIFAVMVIIVHKIVFKRSS